MASAALVAVGALAVLMLGNAQAAIVALVAGLAAILLASMHAEPPDAPADAPPPVTIDGVDEVLAAIAEPVFIVRDRVVVYANPTAIRLLGAHIVGEDVRLAIRNPAALDRLTGTLDLDSQPLMLAGIGAADQRWELRVTPRGDGARIVELVDRTGSYAAERMRVDFVANASHELRTPLASILGYIETLEGDAGEEPAVRNRFLKVMFDQARRMQRLIDDLISLSRIEADKFRPPETTIDLGELLRQVCVDLSHGDRGRDLMVEIAADTPMVTGDTAQLSQALHNLVGNAMKYGRLGTPVTMALRPVGERMVRLIVSDEGEGVAAEHLPRLTERFYRVDAGRSRTLGGTGLGLAIVKHIIERHRGRLDIASTVGLGTRVSITLPAVGPASGSAVVPALAVIKP